MKINLDITKPRFSKQILLVPWPFFISRFHCILVSYEEKIGYIGTPTPPSPASASRGLNNVATDQRTSVTETLNNKRITRKQHIFGSYNLIIQLNQFSAILQRRITYFKRCNFFLAKFVSHVVNTCK